MCLLYFAHAASLTGWDSDKCRCAAEPQLKPTCPVLMVVGRCAGSYVRNTIDPPSPTDSSNERSMQADKIEVAKQSWFESGRSEVRYESI